MQKMIKLLEDKEFTLHAFKLDWQCTPLLAPKVINTINLRYKRLSLYVKTKFYTKQLKIKIIHPKILTLQSC